MTYRLPSLVAGLLVVAQAASAQIQSPTDVFGFRPGTDFKLADYAQVKEYFEQLAARSPRVALDTIGRSSLGKPMLLAIISSDANIANRARYRDISERLATVGDLTDTEARMLAGEGKAIVWIDGGLHATEVAHGQMTPELAHWLATDEGEEARRIRETAITLVMPNMNPDGLDIVVNWYRRNVGTEFETSNVPELYHHYIGHDNNRDWYMFTQAETRAVANQLYHVWFPQIVYNHHQSGPFPGRIWVPPFENPVNPNLDPAVVTSISQIGEAMKRRFALEGKPGVSSGIVYDMWWNGSMRGAPDFHNMLGFLTETALYRYATPHCYSDDEVPEYFNARAGSLPARRPTTQYPDPWLGGCWHLRDPIEYMLTGSKAVLDMASRFREDYLYNIYHIGKRQIAKGQAAIGGPFAYVIDLGEQHDPAVTVEFLRTFRRGGIEIRRADESFMAGGTTYPAGTYIIPPQAFRPFVVDLMEPKTFPDRRQYPGGPPEPPYDMTGYELSLQMGVNAHRITEPFPLAFENMTEIPAAPGGVSGDADWGFAVPRSNAGAVVVNRLLDMGVEISRGETLTTGSGRELEPRWYVHGGDRRQLDALARELGVRVSGLAAGPGVRHVKVRAPRIGLYESYVSNMPGGWTRWMLEQYDFPFETIRDEDIRAGELEDFSVIILPSQSASSIVDGHAPGTMPAEFTGGITLAGANRLGEFVNDGGWLVTVDRSVDFAIEQFDLPVRNVTRGLSSTQFFIPGTLINVDISADPITRGMPDRAIAMFARSQVLDATNSDRVAVFARYPRAGYLASGWAHGAGEYLAGRVAGVRVAVGSGMVVLFAFDPNFRGQPHNTFKLLFNALFESTVER